MRTAATAHLRDHLGRSLARRRFLSVNGVFREPVDFRDRARIARSVVLRMAHERGAPMGPADVIREFHLALWAEGDLSAIERYVSPDARTVMTGFEGNTVAVIREDVERYVGAFADVETEIVDLIAQGDRVAMSWRTWGTHVGPYGDIAPEPTGQRILMEGVDVFTVAAGKIVEVRSFWDAAGVYRQFGLLADGL
jgi:predicted ester cyclase